VFWDGKTIGSWSHKIAGADAVINLAGEPIGIKRWNDSAKQLILNSRIDSAKAIVKAISTNGNSPRVFLSASAASYYGNISGDDVDESRKRGDGFLAETCERWESQARLAESTGQGWPCFDLGLSSIKTGSPGQNDAAF
jgi:NAD dependent epimerase/dehydratase family enzyme